MSAPKLNRPLTLETPVDVPDGAGGLRRSWQKLGVLWGERRGAGGAISGDGEITRAEASWKITVRAAPEGAEARPRPDQRFRDGDRVFRIQAVQESDPSARFLVCRVREEVALS